MSAATIATLSAISFLLAFALVVLSRQALRLERIVRTMRAANAYQTGRRAGLAEARAMLVWDTEEPRGGELNGQRPSTRSQ